MYQQTALFHSSTRSGMHFGSHACVSACFSGASLCYRKPLRIFFVDLQRFLQQYDTRHRFPSLSGAIFNVIGAIDHYFIVSRSKKIKRILLLCHPSRFLISASFAMICHKTGITFSVWCCIRCYCCHGLLRRSITAQG